MRELSNHRWRLVGPAARVEGPEWVKWPEVADAGRFSESSWNELINDVKVASAVLIDDVGASTDKYRSGEWIDRLCRLLERAKNDRVMVTTNCAPADWNGVMGERVAERLLRDCVIVQMNCPSYPGKK
jgi:DNA replication protein DnaC